MTDLPPLPKHRTLSMGDEDGEIQLGYTADQMREYARQAVEAEREACAMEADDYEIRQDDAYETRRLIARAIRSRR